MGKLCIIGFDDNKVIKDFIRLHVENLDGEKVCLSNYFPDYKYQGKTILYYYRSRRFLRKVAKLLPFALYHRLIAKKDRSEAAILDAFRTFFQQHQVDVILAEFGVNGARIAPIAQALGIPLIVHFHGHDAHRTPELTPSLLEQYRFMFNTAHGVLGVSQHMIKTLQALGCDAEKLTYNPYGPRDTFYEVQPTYEPIVLSVGRFTDIKANYLVILAFARALKQVPNARLVMIGEGELLETCKTLAHIEGIADQVDFKGAVPHQELAGYFTHACCFAQHSVTPSYGDAEGTPNTILEAGAAALPVVSTRHAGIKDVVSHNETGLLVDELDVDGMARHMTELLSHPKRCQELGSAARTHIKNNFSSAQHIARLQSVIDHAHR